MIKKYIMIIAVLLAILIFTSTSTASFLSSRLSSRIIYERFPENSAFKRILGRLFQVASNNDDGMSIDTGEDDGISIDTDEDDGEEEDDGKYYDEIDPDGLKEDECLPETIDLVGEKTPDDGNESVDDSKETLNTIDTPDGYEDEAPSGDGTIDYPDGETNNEMMTIDEGGESQYKLTVDSNGEEGTTNEKIMTEADGAEGEVNNEITIIPDYIDEGEWTVKLDRIVEIVTKLNGKLGTLVDNIILTDDD